MVAKQKVSMGEVEVWVDPSSWLRRFLDKVHFPFPYFHFMKPKWKLHVKRLHGPSQTNTLYWWLWLPDGRATGPDVGTAVNIPNLNPGEERVFEIGGRLISPIGNTALCIAPIEWMPLQRGRRIITPQARHHTVYEFRSTAEEELFVGILAGIIAGIFLLLLGLVLRN
jgi:hypothetical protein